MIKKIIKTIRIIKDNRVELKKELKDLTGITKQVVSEIVTIWK